MNKTRVPVRTTLGSDTDYMVFICIKPAYMTVSPNKCMEGGKRKH